MSRLWRVGCLLVMAVALATPPAWAAWHPPLTLVETHDADDVPALAGLQGTLGVQRSGLRLSPDDEQLYVRVVGHLVSFDRDPVDGTLTLLEVVEDGVGGVEGIAEPRDFAFSPDGTTLYVVSDEGALAVFERDGATGLLTQIQVLRDGVGGVDGLANPTSVVVAPDGLHVYVGRNGLEVPERGPTVFARDPGGMLTFLEVTPAAAGIPSERMAMGPDPTRLFSRANDVVLTYAERDPATGSLTPVQTVGPLAPFVDASTIGTSPDGMNVYVAGTEANNSGCCLTLYQMSVLRFEFQPASGTLIRRDADWVIANHFLLDLRPKDFVVTSSGRWMLTNRGVNVRNPVTGVVRAFRFVADASSSPQVTADERFVYSVDYGGPLSVWSWTCGTLGLSAKFVVKNVGADPDPADDVLIMKATGYLRDVAVSDLTLDVDGLHFIFWDNHGNDLSDVVLPGGTYAGSGTVGWTSKQDGRLWQYTDTTGSPVNGVTKVQIRDLGSRIPSMVQVKLLAKAGGSYPIHIGYPGTSGVVDPAVLLELGSPDRCLVTGAVECRPNKRTTREKCH